MLRWTNQAFRPCVRCGVDEPGELVVEVTPASPFLGYTNKEATAKKLIEGVFEQGDRYARTGDLLKVDADFLETVVHT